MSKNYRIRKKGYELVIFEDCIESPREYYKDDNIGIMACFHHRLELGDETPFNKIEDFVNWYNDNKDIIKCCIPLYLIDNEECNGNVSITTDKNDYRKPCQLLGFIYCTTETLKDNWAYDENDEEEILQDRLEDEVMEYDNWLQNIPPYYSFEIKDKDKNHINGQGVFADYGFEDMINEMKERNETKEYNFLFDALLKRERDNCL
ncbi:MAG: hypothetical protein IKI95_03245 [Clostridia bacterium]|nr:hypothetical protein [Clostridia bacterium]